MKKQSFEAWSDVRARLIMNLYGIIRELLGLQFKFETPYFTNVLQAFADSLTDITQDGTQTAFVQESGLRGTVRG